MAATRVVIPYAPRRQFMAYHESAKRWRIIVAHRRAGKTVATINQLIRSALTCEKAEPRVAYIAPLYKQAKDVAWTYLKRFSAAIPGSDANESELRVDLPNGGRIRLYGADNPDGMRGIYLDDCILDEFADMRPRMLPEVIRPALSDRRGSLTLIGTPRGHNDFYHAWQSALNDNDWFSLMLRASETGLVDAEELASARKAMSPEQYEQEFECSFEAAILGAFFGKEMAEADRAGRICDVPIDLDQPVWTAWDLGVRDATAIWFFQPQAGGVNIVDYYEANNVGVEHYAEVLKQRADEQGYKIGPALVPHDAKVKEWGTGRTRVETMLGLGLAPRLVPIAPLSDGIQAGRQTIPQARFDRERCAVGIEVMKQYRSDYDEERKVLRPGEFKDWASHGGAAWRYLSLGWREFREDVVEPKPKADVYFGISAGQIGSALTFSEMIERAKAKRLEGR